MMIANELSALAVSRHHYNADETAFDSFTLAIDRQKFVTVNSRIPISL